MDSRSLPPTRNALIYDIHNSAYVSGHIWGRTNVRDKTDESTSN